MKKQKLFILILPLILVSKSYSQDCSINTPRVTFDGKRLSIFYDLIAKKQSDKFYIWVEITNNKGDLIPAKSFSGELGANTIPGNNKNILWFPENDSVFLNEEVNVEVKGEKYVPLFNKGSICLMSAAVPGLGQTKINNGKPWWLTGAIAYGALTGGLIVNLKYQNTWDSYINEEDPLKRIDFFDKAQKQINISHTLFVSGATIWAVNMFWAILIPNKYQPIKNMKLTINQSDVLNKSTPLLTFRFNF